MFPFHRDYASRDALLKGLDAVYGQVAAWFERLHCRPLSSWRYHKDDDWFEADTGEFLTTTELVDGEWVTLEDPYAGREPICNNKRDFGGTMERFLSAHWTLRETVLNLNSTVGETICESAAYGFALASLSTEREHLTLLDVVTTADIELPDELAA